MMKDFAAEFLWLVCSHHLNPNTTGTDIIPFVTLLPKYLHFIV
jgi:hypothetical protein